MHRLWTALSFALIALAPALASAQTPIESVRSASLSAGASFFDLSGTGVAPMLAARGAFPLNRLFAIDGGMIAAFPTQQFGKTTTFLVPEAGLEFQLPLRIAPYIGADIGRAFDLRSGDIGGTRNEASYSGALGARAWVTLRTGIRAEFRVRGIGPGFTGSAGELTLGVTHR
jgi:hypothetical protein